MTFFSKKLTSVTTDLTACLNLPTCACLLIFIEFFFKTKVSISGHQIPKSQYLTPPPPPPDPHHAIPPPPNLAKSATIKLEPEELTKGLFLTLSIQGRMQKFRKIVWVVPENPDFFLHSEYVMKYFVLRRTSGQGPYPYPHRNRMTSQLPLK